MIRQTSIETYNKIKENGLLSQKRWQVYDWLFHNGPLTCRELMTGIQRHKGASFVVAGGSFSTRFSELERMGVIYIVRERACKETGNMAIEWDVTDRLPIKFEKPRRYRCKHCKGKGYTEELQVTWF